jgi:dephospho-CoA kinase
VTGGIASGKSTAVAHLVELGAERIDADLLGHRVYERGTPGFDAVVRAFGAEIVAPDGAIDRRALGAKVFGRPEQLRRLTDIAWPRIRQLALEEIGRIRRARPEALIALEAAVLLEAGWEDIVDEVWVVIVDPEIAIARLAARNALSREEALARIRSQLSNAQRSARADVVIDNSGTLEQLRAAVEREWAALRQRAAGAARAQG